jgi:uncharacterized protein
MQPPSPEALKMIWPFTKKRHLSPAGRAFMSAMTGEGRAELLEEGHAAYQRNEFLSAIEIWRPMAEVGDAVAQYCLGVMYVKGQGVSQDFVEAAKWLRRSAEQGSVPSQELLGKAYARVSSEFHAS